MAIISSSIDVAMATISGSKDVVMANISASIDVAMAKMSASIAFDRATMASTSSTSATRSCGMSTIVPRMRLATIVVNIRDLTPSILPRSWIGKRVSGAAIHVSDRAEVVQVKAAVNLIDTLSIPDLLLAAVFWSERKS